MHVILAPPEPDLNLPDHTQLPDRDGVPMRNFMEPSQSTLLSDTLRPVLQQLYPEGDFAIGQDSGIYWERTNPPNLGCRAPDWFLVVGVPRLLNGIMRRSYVMWQELVPPLVILEYASDGGAEERDTTPHSGKFWIYERRIRPAYYGLFLPEVGRIEMYQHVADRFARMQPNAAGRYPIASLGVELGTWDGPFDGYDLTWIRWWDAAGQLLPTSGERAELVEHELIREAQRAEQEKQRAEQEKQRADALAARLRELGIDPNAI